MTEWILSASVLILVVIVLRGLLKGRISLRLQYSLWILVLLRLLIPFSLANSRISVSNLAERHLGTLESLAAAPIRSPEYEAARSQVLSVHPPDTTPMPPEQLEREIYTVMYDQTYYRLQREQSETPDAQLQQEAMARVERNTYQIQPVQILLSLWIAGMAVAAAVFLCANLRLWLHLRRSRAPVDAGHRLKVYSTGYMATPCLFGLPKPAIYLPAETFKTHHLSHILAHETTHFLHGDHIWSCLRCICLVIHWYNPLVWLAACLSKRDAELACDEATILRLGEAQRIAYGETLITMTCAKRDPQDLLLTATAMNTGKGSLKERVTMIARHPKTAIRTLIPAILILSLTVGCTFTGYAAEITPGQSSPGPAASPAVSTGQAGFQETILIDNAYVTVKVLSTDPDGAFGYTLNLSMENKCSRILAFEFEYANVNGFCCAPYCPSSYILPGEKSTHQLFFTQDQLTLCGITQVAQIDFFMRIECAFQSTVIKPVDQLFTVYPMGKDAVRPFVWERVEGETVFSDDLTGSITITGHGPIDAGYAVDVYLENHTGAAMTFRADQILLNHKQCTPLEETYLLAPNSRAHMTIVIPAYGRAELEQLHMRLSLSIGSSLSGWSYTVFSDHLLLTP